MTASSAAVAVAMAAAVAGGCGGGADAVHYDEPAAIECARQTNSMLVAQHRRSISVVFPGDQAVFAGAGLAFGDGQDAARRRLDALLRAPGVPQVPPDTPVDVDRG
jgi:hypothetical protein